MRITRSGWWKSERRRGRSVGKRHSPLAFLATLPQAGGLLRGRQAVRLGKLLQTKGFLLLAYLLLAGCGSERESLFEEEHDLPAHWPSGLVDAVDKIRPTHKPSCKRRGGVGA